MRSIRGLLLPLTVLPFCSAAQHWVDLMLDEQTNVQEVKAAFDAHWQGRTVARGKGWKQFQRWYWFMEQRTYPTGERLDPAIHLQAAAEVRAARAQRSAVRDAAVWAPLGPTNWTSISYNPGNGRVNIIETDPNNPSVLYAGTPSSGLWRSEDHGGSWQPLFTDLPSMGVSGIAVHPTEPGLIYIATGDGDGADTYSAGVLKSTDNGATWSPTGLNWSIAQSRTTRALRMDPSDPARLYCAASNGLFRTVDGGDTWQMTINGSFRDVEFKPGDPTQLYACTDRFFRSVAEGTSFTPSNVTGLPAPEEVGRMAIAVSAAAPEMVYALCSREDDSGFLGLYRSTDGGLTFSLRSDSPNLFGYGESGNDSGGQAWYDMALAVDPLDPEVVYVGGINVWKSTDGGATWQIKSHWVFPSEIGYTHADIHSLDIRNGKLYCGSDGGVHVSDDGAANWTDLSAGLDIMQFYRMGSSELLPQLVMAGAQDNGSNRLLNGAWTHVFGADGMEAAVDPFNANVVFSSSQNGGLRRSDNSGEDWTSLTDDMFEEGAWVTPFALDPTVPGRMLSGFNNLLYSEDQGDNWIAMTSWPTDQFVRCLAFAPSNSDVWYVARNDRMERLTDAGWEVTDIRPGLPNLSPTSFAVDHDDPLHVWVSFSGTSNGNKVFESTDGGLTWANRSSGLPNTPVNSVVAQPGSPNGLYAGTDLGVFYRDDYTGAWEPYGTGMPNVVVSELEINMSSGKLRAATYGRGIWEADLFISPFAGMDGRPREAAFRVIPLDAEGRFAIQAGSDAGRLQSVRVFDATGRAVLMEGRSADLSEIDLRGARAGAYLVQGTFEQGTWCRRVVR
jgi:hypothetical protein